MHLKAAIVALSFLTISAFPLHRNSREATWSDLKANQAYEKADLPKNVDNLYKSHLDSNNLYNQGEDDSRNPVAEEVQHKINMESERLRSRLRQELAELHQRLSSSPAHLTPTLASMRERLAPFVQQLRSSLSSNTKDLCGQLSLYLQSLEAAGDPAGDSPARYPQAFHQMTQAFEHSSSKLADIISDFHTKAQGVIEHLTEVGAAEGDSARSELWPIMSSRLEQEVSSLRAETQSWVGALQEELAAPFQTEVKASAERFCQQAALQSQVFEGRMEKLFQGLEEELENQRASGLSSSSSPSSAQPAGSLQEDFSMKLSALIQDILHSVQ